MTTFQPVGHTLGPTFHMTEIRPSDMLLWNYQLPFGNPNNEAETYLPGNRYISNGELILEGRNTGGGNVSYPGGGKYTSGMVSSANCFSFRYGYVEVYAKVPGGLGTWPAIWMLYTTVPQSNEIDIVEIFEDPTKINDGLHFPNGGSTGSDGGPTTEADVSTGYHAYGINWQPTFVEFFFDGVSVRKITTQSEIPTAQMYLIMNVALGGVAVNGDLPADSQFPIQMHIKYARIWQENTSPYQLVTTLTPNYGSYKNTVKAQGATSYYPLNDTSGTTATEIITGANGTISASGVTLGQTPLITDQSKSMLFDGVNGNIVLPSNIKPDGLTAWSVVAWFEYPTTPTHAGRFISNDHTDQTNRGFQISLNTSAGGLCSLALPSKTVNLYFGTTITTATAHMICMTYDGAHVYAYLDAVQVGNDTATGGIIAANYPITIGKGAYGADPWAGLGGQVTFYNGVALTPLQIASQWNAGRVLYNAPALVSVADAPLMIVSVSDKGLS